VSPPLPPAPVVVPVALVVALAPPDPVPAADELVDDPVLLVSPVLGVLDPQPSPTSMMPTSVPNRSFILDPPTDSDDRRRRSAKSLA
jgi:hypothetical protein